MATSIVSPQIRIAYDNVREIAFWAAKHYEIRRLKISYVDFSVLPREGKHLLGYMDIHPRRTPNICLSTALSNVQLGETMLHELAHLLTWRRQQKMGHGRQFQENLDEVCEAWAAFLERDAAKLDKGRVQ